MEPLLNPTKEQKEFYLSRIPTSYRSKFSVLDTKLNEFIKVSSIFQIRLGDIFIRNGEKFIAESNPYVNAESSPTIKCRKCL